jgi:hypothetical protein
MRDEDLELLLTAFELEPLRRTKMPVAPFLENVLGYDGCRRFVAFTKSRSGLVYWTDGVEDGYAFVVIWDRFITHPVIAPHVSDCRFIARVVEPEELTIFENPEEALKIELEELGDAILLDWRERTVWTGLFARVALHLAVASVYEEVPADDENPDCCLQGVDAMLQQDLLDWLDHRLAGTSRVCFCKGK